ncbi:hypothetical protein RB594_009069 [Gaeumannomyces avenae]
MPFLRRRGVMASESDMRRRTNSQEVPLPDVLPSTGKHLQPLQENPVVVQPAANPPALSDAAPSDPDAPSASDPAPPGLTPADRPSADEPGPRVSSLQLPIRAQSPPLPDETKYRRFSMLRFRNASDSQLSIRAKQQSETPPPLPPLPDTPSIITTAPTSDLSANPKKPPRKKLPFGLGDRDESSGQNGVLPISKRDRRKTMNLDIMSGSRQAVTFEDPRHHSMGQIPPAYGEESEGSGLALPFNNRLSESSRSDGSFGDHRVYGSTTTTTHTVHTTTTFFRLPRRKQKQPEPMFPIAHLQKGGDSQVHMHGVGSNTSLSARTPERASTSSRITGNETPTPSRPSSSRRDGSATSPSPSPAVAFMSRQSVSPATALFRPESRNSGQSSPSRGLSHLRGRSSTMSSLGRKSMDDRLAAPQSRTSASIGRKSFGDLLGLGKIRHTNGGRPGTLTPATPGSSASKNNSLQLARDSVILPERRDDDTPAKYLARLEEVVSRSVIASALSKNADQFSQAVLRSYMRGFRFFGDPMDMSIRKLLMEAELPKETQQIDRCLQAFANRYHECNPGIYADPDQAYFIAFSLLILHTDVFNKNNKYKMQKTDYLKNTRGEGIFDDILECFYDNISYTPFIHVEDDLDINGERIIAHKSKKKTFILGGNPDPAKRVAKEPIDPYTLIIDNKLDILRPNLKDVMHLEDTYGYIGVEQTLNLQELHKTFFKTGVLQIVSARSRPDAFMSEKTATNPQEAQAGIVDIKITKVGLLWRKDVKKKKTRSPWQEWGAILTGAQLYFFRNTSWVKNLMHQYDTHIKNGHDGIPVIFHPPLDQFKPDGLMSTDGAVALLDSSYKKHKNAFVYVKHGGSEEVLLADNEEELNDWLAKLNYAAAFRTSGVRMRGVVGGSYDGQTRRAMRRLESESSQSVQTPTGEVTISRSRIDQKMAQDILEARREVMSQRIADANERIQAEESKLEDQLRNARHLQLLAPVQPKTRDQILVAAARIAAQLKWTRMEMWRLKCHRDILLMDLEEERLQLDLIPSPRLHPNSSPEKTGSGRDEARNSMSTIVQQSPKAADQAPRRLSAPALDEPIDSPETDVFQTPPTSAPGHQGHHRQHSSWDLPPRGLEALRLRKASISSAISAISAAASPPRKIPSSQSTPAIASASNPAQPTEEHSDELDAAERDLLEQAGLIDAEQARAAEAKSAAATLMDGGEGRERHEGTSYGSSADKQDRSKIRRSLQRTLRESAGHLSHHRSTRKGKEPASGAYADEEPARETDVLTRGSGSFVVHGKKASVISFGGELQAMTPDQRLRNRKSQQSGAPRDDAASPPAGDGEPPAADYQAVLESPKDPERRESAASASTATARSFRELHRKYSSAQAYKSSPNLPLPDEDSDAAVSFSEGRRTPLPPIEHDSDEEAWALSQESPRPRQGSGQASSGVLRKAADSDDSGDDDEERGSGFLSPPDSAGAHSRYLTPEPSSSRPGSRSSNASGDEREAEHADRQIQSPPPIQVVGA